MRSTILHGHVLDMLATLPEESVQMAVTSPPYWGLRKYAGVPDFTWPDGWLGQYGLEPTVSLYVQHTVEVLRAIRRVLRSDGVCFFNLGDSYAGSHCELKPKDLCLIPQRVALAAQSDGWWVRSDIIWNKTNPMPESVTDRPTDAYEHILMLTKSARYYWDAEAVKEPVAESTIGRGPVDFGGAKGRAATFEPNDPNFRNGSEQWGRRFDYTESCANGRNLRNIWAFTTGSFSEWTRSDHWLRVRLDEAKDGTLRIASTDCQVSGHADFPCGGREDCMSSDISDIGDGRVPMRELSGDASSKCPALLNPASSLDSKPLGNSLFATDRNNESCKTGLVPVTTPPCKPCDGISAHTDGKLDSPASVVLNPGTSESRTWPDELGVHSLGQIKHHIVDKSSLPILPNCTCIFYHKVSRSTSHFAVFPEALPEKCILAASKEGDTVLDPFAGSGTTGIVATKLGRQSILIEASDEYIKMIRDRTAQEGMTL